MGSFAFQQHLLDHSADLDAAVLSGTSAGDVIAAGIDTSQPADLAAFNAGFEPARTGYEWLSRDEAEVDMYVADPDCGFSLAMAPMAEMVAATAATADPDRLAAIRNDLPIYVFSGDADPLAGGGALIELVGDRYREAGVRDVTVRLYPGARHETLNETNRDEVTADLVAWLDRVVTAERRSGRPDEGRHNVDGVFTGIVEELGRVDARTADRLRIACTTVLDDVEMGASIAVNGCCLTVVAWRRRPMVGGRAHRRDVEAHEPRRPRSPAIR